MHARDSVLSGPGPPQPRVPRGCARGLRSGQEGRVQRGHEPHNAPERPRRLASHDAARPAAKSRASQRCQPRCSCLPAWTGSFLAQLEAKARRRALPPQLLTHTASTGWRVMCRRAEPEGRRMMTGELTFVAICTCSRNAVAFGVDRSRSLKYAGSFAQLSAHPPVLRYLPCSRFFEPCCETWQI